MRRRLNQSGVTLVELMVVIVVSSSMISLVLAFALNFWGDSIALGNSQDTLVSRLNASEYVHKSVGQATGFINQNDIADNNTAAPDPAIVSGKYWKPIHAKPGLITVGTAGTNTPLLYYKKPSVNTSKSIIMNGNIPYEDNVLLYMNGTTKQLLARTLINPSASPNLVRTSCPPATASTSCPEDTVVSEDVSGVSMRYFSRSGNLIDYTSITDPNTQQYIGPDFPSVEIVELTVKYFRKAQLGKADTNNQTVIRVALRN